MKLVGLTGGLAMGKSTAARLVRRLKVPVHDSDAVVHRLYQRGGLAVPLLAARFPTAICKGRVDRAQLRAEVMADAQAFADLEALIHPLVQAQTQAWLKQQRRRQRPVAVLDSPLLFETGQHRNVNLIWVVHCAPWLQRQRALRRVGVTPEIFERMVDRQAPQSLRLKHADQVLPTGLGLGALFRAVRSALKQAQSDALDR